MTTSRCIPVQAKSRSELLKKIKAALPHADLIEIWIDQLQEQVNPKDIIQAVGRPVLIVNKPRREQGRFTGKEKDRIDELINWTQAGAAYIDVGLDTPAKHIRRCRKNKGRAKLIISHHDFKATPDSKILWRKVQKAVKRGADIVKIATYARSPHDNTTIFELLGRARKNGIKLAAMAMGKHGHLSRIGAPLLGAPFTFIALDGRQRTASGQICAADYEQIMALLKGD